MNTLFKFPYGASTMMFGRCYESSNTLYDLEALAHKHDVYNQCKSEFHKAYDEIGELLDDGLSGYLPSIVYSSVRDAVKKALENNGYKEKFEDGDSIGWEKPA